MHLKRLYASPYNLGLIIKLRIIIDCILAIIWLPLLCAILFMPFPYLHDFLEYFSFVTDTRIKIVHWSIPFSGLWFITDDVTWHRKCFKTKSKQFAQDDTGCRMLCNFCFPFYTDDIKTKKSSPHFILRWQNASVFYLMQITFI